MLNKLGKKKKINFKIILETTKTLNIYKKNVRMLRWKNNKKKTENNFRAEKCNDLRLEV